MYYLETVGIYMTNAEKKGILIYYGRNWEEQVL